MTSPTCTWYIETPRLTISHLLPERDAHCDFIVTLYNTPEFIASTGGTPTGIITRQAARQLLAGRFHQIHTRFGHGTYLVSLKQQQHQQQHHHHQQQQCQEQEKVVILGENQTSSPLDNAVPIGTVSLMRGLDANSYTVPDLGFAILPAYMRRGYTKEACGRLLEYARTELGLKEVLGLHDPRNQGSYAVFRSLGFKDQGPRVLEAFGGVVGQVWTLTDAPRDHLSVYGLPDEVALGTLEKDEEKSEPLT